MAKAIERADRGAAGDDLLSAEEVLSELLEDPILRVRAMSCVLPAINVGLDWRFRRRDLWEWVCRQHETRSAELRVASVSINTEAASRGDRCD